MLDGCEGSAERTAKEPLAQLSRNSVSFLTRDTRSCHSGSQIVAVMHPARPSMETTV